LFVLHYELPSYNVTPEHRHSHTHTHAHTPKRNLNEIKVLALNDPTSFFLLYVTQTDELIVVKVSFSSLAHQIDVNLRSHTQLKASCHLVNQHRLRSSFDYSTKELPARWTINEQ